MLFSVFSGLACVLPAALCLAYPFLRGRFWGSRRLHAVAGGLLCAAVLVHINFKLAHLSLSFGFLAAAMLTVSAAAGLLARRMPWLRWPRAVHVVSAGLFLLLLLLHAGQRMLELLVL